MTQFKSLPGNKANTQCKEWLKEQRQLSGTWSTEFELWNRYPYKDSGLSRESFSAVLKGLLNVIA